MLRGAFTIGTIVAFSAYLTQLYRPLTALTNAQVEFATSLVSFERVFEVLDIPVDVEDRPDAVMLEQCRGHIRLENVSFSYDADPDSTVALADVERFSKAGSSLIVTKSGEQAGSYRSASRQEDHEQRQVLQAIDFEMQPGQLTALVGPSGAGKTTITYLVPRLYDPSDGRILAGSTGICTSGSSWSGRIAAIGCPLALPRAKQGPRS